MMAIPISRRPRDYLIFFRREIVRTVKWAGDPNKPVTVGPLGARLTPRKSFELWQQTAEGQSAPWSTSHIRLAEALRVTLLEVVLKHTDLIEGERKAAQQRQDLLIAELNHRVRNILGLIRGLIRQIANPKRSTAEFVAVLDDRIQALARAHDQLTQKQWAAGSLHEMIENEAAAYLADKASRVIVSGPDVGLRPESFSALALVLHELTTNSAKYGALCDQRGKVSVMLSRLPNNDLQIDWVESGGPAVKAPKLGGFGSVVINRSITHDLDGTVDLDFRIEGLRARLIIAADHLADAPQRSKKAPSQPVLRHGKVDIPDGPVLVVEDNVIIAMDCEAILKDMGCRDVQLSSNSGQALKLLEHKAFVLAVLDVNLGTETSFPIADALVARGIPYVFASGYAEGVTFPAEHENAPRVGKPFDRATLTAGIAAALSAQA
jgi:two-component sensor histidine kinase/CheY-like chemotaxis protein